MVTQNNNNIKKTSQWYTAIHTKLLGFGILEDSHRREAISCRTLRVVFPNEILPTPMMISNGTMGSYIPYISMHNYCYRWVYIHLQMTAMEPCHRIVPGATYTHINRQQIYDDDDDDDDNDDDENCPWRCSPLCQLSFRWERIWI